MKQIVKMIEVKSVDELNKLLAEPEKYRLYERLVNGGEITFLVSELKTLP